MIKRILALLLTSGMLLSLAACRQNEEVIPDATEPTTTAPVDEPEHFDLNEIDLTGIGELLVERGQEGSCKIQLDGLCTPVILELEGTDIVAVSAYGISVYPDAAAEEYTGIYGNLDPVIYEQDGLIFLNIWHYDTGYTCVLCPDGTYMETYPDDEYSVMIYLDEEGRMCQSQFALKFLGIEQWDTGPIDMAVSRDDFYYRIDDAAWTEEEFSVSPREVYTISDCFALDEIFDNAKAQGLYPEFDTLDELLAYNAARKDSDDDSEPLSPSRDEVVLFDQVYAARDYDEQHNLLTEFFYTHPYDSVYFAKHHTYDENNREIAGTWSFGSEEAYRYTNAYDDKDRLTETVWYQGDQEVERFTYTYDKKGGHTETFAQNGKKQYTYTFNDSGQLTAHSVYKDDKEIKTEDVKSLVKAELLTDIWFPFMDNDTLHSHYRYNGTVPTETPANARKTAAADGSYILIQEGVDEEFEEAYRHEYHYSADDQLLRAVHCWEGVESYRDEYQYDSNGLCILQVTYIDGEKDMTTQRQYNSAGQLISIERDYADENYDYILTEENGEEVTKEYAYTNRKETYRYNDRGLLAETVVYGDGQQIDRKTYEYDSNGYVLPSMDTYEYVYNAEGVLEGIWLIYEDYSAGMAQLRSRTVYVTAENAHQLQEIMRSELSWF